MKKKQKKAVPKKTVQSKPQPGKGKIPSIIEWLQNLLNSKKGINARETRAIDEFDRIQLIATGRPDPGTQVDIGHVSGSVGVTKQTITSWRKAGFPRGDGRTVWTGEVFAWFYDAVRKARANDKEGEFMNVRIRRTEAQAIREELILAEEMGRLVDRQKMIRNFRAHIAIVSRLMQDLPKRLARHVPAKVRKTFVDESDREITDLLNSFAEWREEK